jgi:hypothetical protein
MTVSRAQFLALLEPGLRDIKSDANYPRRSPIYPAFYGEMSQSSKAKETFQQIAGIGDFQVKTEGGNVTYTDPINGNQVILTHVRRSNGFKITQEMIDHKQYQEALRLERDLQIAGDEDLEIAGHLILNNAFSTSDDDAYGFDALGFDGLALCSTAHTRLDGGANQANRPSTDVDLGWTALADATIQFALWRDHRGRRIVYRPRTLVIHPNDRMTAKEILGSSQKPYTQNNEINAMLGEGLTQDSVIETPYLTDTDSWFLLAEKSMLPTKWFWDVSPRTAMEDDFDLEIIKRKRVHGFSLGHTDWPGVYGSSGAN